VRLCLTLRSRDISLDNPEKTARIYFVRFFSYILQKYNEFLKIALGCFGDFAFADQMICE
jgi:hypothetical protein